MLLVGGTVLAIAFALWRTRKLWKTGEKDKAKVVLAAVLLILGGWAVYGAFYFQAGFPAGESLNSSDWLSFLGGYLGFAGSLIMAWLVYLQDTRLKELTLEEYAAAFSCKIRGVQRKVDTEEERKRVLDELEPGKKTHGFYFKHDVFPLAQEVPKPNEKAIPVLFLSLQNVGKLPVKKMRFEKVELEPYKDQKESYIYGFKTENGGNILNGKHELLPEGTLSLCLAMHSLPEKLEFSSFRLTFSFELGAKRKEQTILFYIQVNQGSDVIVSDGENVF